MRLGAISVLRPQGAAHLQDRERTVTNSTSVGRASHSRSADDSFSSVTNLINALE